jgi:hypothetical protein
MRLELSRLQIETLTVSRCTVTFKLAAALMTLLFCRWQVMKHNIYRGWPATWADSVGLSRTCNFTAGASGSNFKPKLKLPVTRSVSDSELVSFHEPCPGLPSATADRARGRLAGFVRSFL